MLKIELLLVLIAAVAIQSAASRDLGEVIREKAASHSQVIVKRDNGTSNDTIVEVFPEWHLLNPGGVINGSGMLLAAVGDRMGHSCGSLNTYLICREMGYQGLLGISWAGDYFDTAYIDEFPVVVTDVISPNNDTRYYYDSNNTQCNAWAYYVECDPGVEPTEPPAPTKEVYFELMSLIPGSGNITTEQPEGMVVAIVVTDNDWDNLEYGTVCDDNVNQAAADMVCASKGHNGTAVFGNVQKWNYTDNFPEITKNVTTIMDQLYCPEGARGPEDCSYDLYLHDCSFSENLVVFCSNASEPEYELVFGALYKWDEGSPVPSNEGLAVVAVRDVNTGEETWGTVCDDSFNNRSADIACQAIGFDYAISWGNHRNYQYIPESEVANMSIVMDNFNCPAAARNISDCRYDLIQHDCSHSEDIVLHCSAGDVNPTNDTEPEYKIVYGTLYEYRNGSFAPSNKGLAVVEVVDIRTGESTMGTVCDDSFNNRSADIACQAMGFDYAVSWGNNRNYTYVPESVLANVSIVMDEFNCQAAARNISDCSYDLMKHDCSHQEDIIMHCSGGDVNPTNDTEPEYEIVYGALYEYRNGSAVPSNKGIAVVGVRDTRTGAETYGTVCDDSFNNRSADIACQAMGFDYAVSWGNNRNYTYFPESMLANVSIVMDEFNCPAAARNISDCSYDLMKHDCSHQEDIIMHCSGGDVNPTNDTEPEYEIVYGALYEYRNGSFAPSNKGLAVVEVVDIRTGESTMGTVCDDSFNNRTADIACQAMGFDYAVSWGNNRNYTYFPESMLVDVSIVMDQFICPAGARNISDCSYDLMKHDCSHQEDIIMHCSGGSDLPPTDPTWGPTEPTRGPTSYPLDDEIAVKFGGLEVQLKVNPKKARAKIADVLEELADILG